MIYVDGVPVDLDDLTLEKNVDAIKQEDEVNDAVNAHRIANAALIDELALSTFYVSLSISRIVTPSGFGNYKLTSAGQRFVSGLNVLDGLPEHLDQLHDSPVAAFYQWVKARAPELTKMPMLNFDRELAQELMVKHAELKRTLTEFDMSGFKSINKEVLLERSRKIKEFTDSLFRKHARLMVVRVDFGYRRQGIAPNDVNLMRRQVLEDRRRLINNMRFSNIFRHLLGYLMRLEFAPYHGFHIHAAFFFDGSYLHGDASKGRAICDYWNKLTSERGSCYNCNASKDRYDKLGKLMARGAIGLGIGQVDRKDAVKRHRLDYALQYFAKDDQYGRIVLDKGIKLLTHGRVKGVTMTHQAVVDSEAAFTETVSQGPLEMGHIERDDPSLF